MKNKNRNTAEYQASGRLAAKADFRQREIRRQKFCRRSWFPPVSFTVEVRSNRLPGNFFQMIPNHPFVPLRDQGHRHHFVIVRIYYLEMQFIRDFTRILPAQFCALMAQGG
jgi:hypothetical protein